MAGLRTPASATPAVVAHYSRSSRVLHVTLEGTEEAGVQGMGEGAVTRSRCALSGGAG